MHEPEYTEEDAAIDQELQRRVQLVSSLTQRLYQKWLYRQKLGEPRSYLEYCQDFSYWLVEEFDKS
jgi:hypothetical protein